ncbi:hypothetical protein GY45DRAFT_1339945 [Cubamyces sp. BRFM 1775]|nr:hypothetical protein GY45DRAFT_1339945 [Cubamyces sp. BRFM 1775]
MSSTNIQGPSSTLPVNTSSRTDTAITSMTIPGVPTMVIPHEPEPTSSISSSSSHNLPHGNPQSAPGTLSVVSSNGGASDASHDSSTSTMPTSVWMDHPSSTHLGHTTSSKYSSPTPTQAGHAPRTHLSTVTLALAIVAPTILFLSLLITLFVCARRFKRRRSTPPSKNLGANNKLASLSSDQGHSDVETPNMHQRTIHPSTIVSHCTSLASRAVVPIPRPSSSYVEDTPLLRHSTASSSSASSLALSLISEGFNHDVYIPSNPLSITDGMDSGVPFSAIPDSRPISGGSFAEGTPAPSVLPSSIGGRDIMSSTGTSMTERSFSGWHPSRMVRPSEAPGGNLGPAQEDDTSLSGMGSHRDTGSAMPGEMGVAF